MCRGCGGAAGCLARVCGQVRCCECGGGGVVSVCVGWWVQRVSVEGALVKRNRVRPQAPPARDSKSRWSL